MIRRIGIHTALACLLAAGSAAAQEKKEEGPKLGWGNTTEFSFVATAGNSETTTLGFKDKLWRQWERALFEVNAGAVRSESATNRRAVGTTGDFDIEDDTELTAESYYLNGRYDRKVTDRFFWFGGAGWERNTFAGIENRYSTVAGVGNIWSEGDHLRFRTDYALTYTKQEDVVEVPDTDDKFAGVRVSWAYWHKFLDNVEYVNDLIVDANLEESDDWRANMVNSVAVAMSERLALKMSLQFLYDHQPSFEELPLFDTTGADTGTTVLVELDELDTIFTSSLVINF